MTVDINYLVSQQKLIVIVTTFGQLPVIGTFAEVSDTIHDTKDEDYLEFTIAENGMKCLIRRGTIVNVQVATAQRNEPDILVAQPGMVPQGPLPPGLR